MGRLKIIRAKLPAGRHFPVAEPQFSILAQLSSEEISSRISLIRLKDDRQTTQEARVVWRGNLLEIDINFCLDGNCSRLLTSGNKRYTTTVERLGGTLNLETKQIHWASTAATRYTYFLFAHELAHVRYIEDRERDLGDFRTSKKEEQWCDEYALKRIEQLVNLGVL